MTAQQITDIRSRLELFLDEQNGRVFTNEDVVEYLEMTGEFNNTPATLQYVFDELLQLNCTVDINVSYMKKPFQLIGLTGTAGCGKDTVAEFLRDVYAFRPVSLADPIRRGVCEMFGLSHEYMTDRVLKEQPIHHLCNKSPRQLMQTLGTEWGRNHICTHIWLNIAQRKIDMDRKLYERNNSFPEGIVVSDIRFDGEAKWLKEQGGEIWFINRPDNPHALTDNDHESEAGVSLEYIDKTIINDSDVDELYERIALLMECHTEINQPETEAS